VAPPTSGSVSQKKKIFIGQARDIGARAHRLDATVANGDGFGDREPLVHGDHLAVGQDHVRRGSRLSHGHENANAQRRRHGEKPGHASFHHASPLVGARRRRSRGSDLSRRGSAFWRRHPPPTCYNLPSAAGPARDTGTRGWLAGPDGV
jgi:hypothetical protein